MNDQLKSQLLGISLALATAIGAVAYEKLVKAFSLRVVLIVFLLFYLPALLTMVIWEPRAAWSETKTAFTSKAYAWPIFIYWITCITTPIWYYITKKQGVMVGATYEFKYIVILTLFYIFFGSTRMSWNTIIGIVLAMGSVYFVSKS